MIIDIDNKLINNMLVDAFNELGEDVTLSFEEKIVVSKGMDLNLFKNIDKMKLNDVVVKSNLRNLTEILKTNNEKSLSINLEGQNPVAIQVFDMVFDDIAAGNVINIETTKEMNENNVAQNMAFLSMNTKNSKIQEEEQSSFEMAIETMVQSVKSVLLEDGAVSASYDGDLAVFDMVGSAPKGLSVLNFLPSFLTNSYELVSVIDVINCYSNCHCNCHSNCHNACHSSRGWR